MAQDPTAANRSAIADWFKSIIPDNSPLSQSGQVPVQQTLSPQVQKLRDDELISKQNQNVSDLAPYVSATQGDINNPREIASPPPMSQPMLPKIPSYNAGLGTLDKAANLYVEGANKEAAAYDYQANEAEKLNKEKIRQDQEDEVRKEAEMADFVNKSKEYEDAIDSKKLDPTRMFSNMSTGNKILAGLSIFLGGFDPSGQNKALGIIQNSIERDIDAQKEDYARAVAKKQEHNSLYGKILEKYKDKGVARSMAIGGMYQALSMRTQAMAAQAKSPQVKAAILEKRAAFEQEKEKNYGAAVAKVQENMQKNSGLSVPGFQGQAPTEKEAIELRAKVNSFQNAQRELGTLMSFNNLGSKFSPEDAAKAGVAAAALKASIRKEIIGEGTVSETDQKLLDSVVRDPTRLFNMPSKDKAALTYLGEKLKAGLYNSGTSLGLIPSDYLKPKSDFSKRKI